MSSGDNSHQTSVATHIADIHSCVCREFSFPNYVLTVSAIENLEWPYIHSCLCGEFSFPIYVLVVSAIENLERPYLVLTQLSDFSYYLIRSNLSRRQLFNDSDGSIVGRCVSRVGRPVSSVIACLGCAPRDRSRILVCVASCKIDSRSPIFEIHVSVRYFVALELTTITETAAKWAGELLDESI
jgi:hypothetical protein